LKLKGIDGSPHKQWSMWFNSTQREEPYQGLTSRGPGVMAGVPLRRNPETGGAWLSSARVVRCWVKSRNERNPYCQLLRKSTLTGLPLTKRRKVGMTSNHHAPYVLGYTRTTMARTKGGEAARRSKSRKNRPSSDCRLQPACMKSELLVIADQHAAVNTFPGFVHTARQTMRVGNTRSL
jgi:hypothetical protein